MKISIYGTSSLGLLTRLVFAHVFGTLFAYLVYIRFTQLGDRYEQAGGLAEYLSYASNGRFDLYAIYLYCVSQSRINTSGFSRANGAWGFHSYCDLACFSRCVSASQPQVILDLQFVSSLFSLVRGVIKEQLVILSGLVVLNFVAKRSFAKEI